MIDIVLVIVIVADDRCSDSSHKNSNSDSVRIVVVV